MSQLYQSLSHSKWDCKYHVVFDPSFGVKRCSMKFGNISSGPVFHELARQQECRIVEGHLLPDHVHMCIEMPPKYAVSSIIGFLKGKSAYAFGGAKLYALARQFKGNQRHFNGENFWARGDAVSTVGFELETVRRYIREQEAADQSGRF